VTCTEPGCTNTRLCARGRCSKHYYGALKEGSLVAHARMSELRVDGYAASGGACMNGSARCDKFNCRFHLAEFTANGRPINPDLAQPCALMHSARGGMTLQEVSALFGCTRERVRQIQERALRKVGRALERNGWPANDVIAAMRARGGGE
jgi:hypothetical protein